MTRRSVRLMRVRLTYRDGMVLHTARSGAVDALDELRLVVHDNGDVAALGATRLNIEYLSGIAAETLCRLCAEAFDVIDWRNGLGAPLPADLPAPARMLFEMAAADGAARAAQVPLATWLGGAAPARVQTNQTLFWSDDATMLDRARAYAARGFDELKLRVAMGTPDDDVRRINLLRAALGATARLSADANGAWTEAQALAVLPALAARGVIYIEQPIAPNDWSAVARLSRASPLPVMLDESLADAAAIDTLIATRAAPIAHLKLAKLGGLDRMMEAGRALRQADLAVMVGQMNEGTVSTLAAAHAAASLGADYRELYGADGLAHDPAGALRYADGALDLPPGPGLGLVWHELSGPLLREHIT